MKYLILFHKLFSTFLFSLHLLFYCCEVSAKISISISYLLLEVLYITASFRLDPNPSTKNGEGRKGAG